MWVEILYGGEYWKLLWPALIIDCADVILRTTQDKHYHFTQARAVLERDLSLRAEHIVCGKLLEKVLGDVLNITYRVIGRLLTTLTIFLVYFQIIK